MHTHTVDPAYKRVLVVDDDADTVEMLCAYLDLEGHSVHSARSARDALRSLADFEPDVILFGSADA